MEPFLFQAGLILLALSIFGFLGYRAWTEGVLGMLWAIAGITAGLVAGYLVFKVLDDLFGVYFTGGRFPFVLRLVLAIATGLVTYVVVRVIAKKLLTYLFEAGGHLDGYEEGLSGALLSLIPSTVVVVIVFTCLRMGATLQELNHIDRLTMEFGEANYTAVSYPSWPTLPRARNALEQIPLTLEIFNPVDPVSRPDERKLAILVMIARNTFLLNRFRHDPETRDLFGAPEIHALIENGTLIDLATTRKYFDLLTHPLVRQTADNEGLMEEIEKLDLERLLREFILQGKVKSDAIIR